MTTDLSLLPPNSTAQERSIETALRAGDALRAAIDLIRTAKESPPDNFVFWLIYEYGLEELLPYLDDPRIVLQDGIAWQRIRGTPASLLLAFPWIGRDGTTIEEEDATSGHWFEYQLATDAPLDSSEVKRLHGLATLSAPVGTRLSRMYYGYDMRRAIYDGTSWSDGSLWSAESGVIDPNTGVIISFGEKWQSSVSLTDGGETTCTLQMLETYSAIATYEDRLFWDVAAYGDVPTINPPFQEIDLLSILTSGVGRNIRVADGAEAMGSGGRCNGGLRAEIAQLPFKWIENDLSTELHGWSSFSGWSSTRKWTD